MTNLHEARSSDSLGISWRFPRSRSPAFSKNSREVSLKSSASLFDLSVRPSEHSFTRISVCIFLVVLRNKTDDKHVALLSSIRERFEGQWLCLCLDPWVRGLFGWG